MRKKEKSKFKLLTRENKRDLFLKFNVYLLILNSCDSNILKFKLVLQMTMLEIKKFKNVIVVVFLKYLSIYLFIHLSIYLFT